MRRGGSGDVVPLRRKKNASSSISARAASKKETGYGIKRYGTGRFWALYEGGELVCVTVYKKGAKAVQERLEALRARISVLAGHLEDEEPIPLPSGGAGVRSDEIAS